VVAPQQFVTRVVAQGWTPALEPHQHVPLIDLGRGTEEDFAHAGNVAGAVVLVHQDEMRKWADLDAEYDNASVITKRAVNAKVLALVLQSTRPHDLLYRHTDTVTGEIEALPMLTMAREDAERIARLQKSGEKLFADISIPNKIGGPIETANVIAELKGSEKPEEFVVLGAHLDSWDLGTGALDNGCNAALVVDALRAIKNSGAPLHRSIRFALFSGEEQGLLGSWAYVHAHRQELDNAIAAVIFDDGNGRITGFSLSGRKDLVPAVARLIAPLKREQVEKISNDASADTDNYDFFLEGVPTLVGTQDEANYLINYHAMSDTFDKVDINELKKHVAIAADVTYALASSAGRLGPRQDRAQVERLLHETHLDDSLKETGGWADWVSGKRGRLQ
jgi:Zn-dependent M28 family amino/carboxypeptidase